MLIMPRLTAYSCNLQLHPHHTSVQATFNVRSDPVEENPAQVATWKSPHSIENGALWKIDFEVLPERLVGIRSTQLSCPSPGETM